MCPASSWDSGVVANIPCSTTVGQKFLELEPQIFSLLDNIKAKRPEFDNAGFGLIDVIGLLRQNLQEQQQSAKALGEAVSPPPFFFCLRACST